MTNSRDDYSRSAVHFSRMKNTIFEDQSNYLQHGYFLRVKKTAVYDGACPLAIRRSEFITVSSPFPTDASNSMRAKRVYKSAILRLDGRFFTKDLPPLYWIIHPTRASANNFYFVTSSTHLSRSYPEKRDLSVKETYARIRGGLLRGRLRMLQFFSREKLATLVTPSYSLATGLFREKFADFYYRY